MIIKKKLKSHHHQWPTPLSTQLLVQLCNEFFCNNLMTSARYLHFIAKVGIKNNIYLKRTMQFEKANHVWLKSLMYNNKKLVTLNIQAWTIFNPFQKKEEQLNNIQLRCRTQFGRVKHIQLKRLTYNIEKFSTISYDYLILLTKLVGFNKHLHLIIWPQNWTRTIAIGLKFWNR
jgi:hypothetical protein